MRLNNAISLVPLDDLVPYLRNSRTHSAEQVAQLAESIVEFGFTNPILIDGQNNIIAGYGRFLAACKLDLRQVPVIRLDYMTEAQRRAYVIADNKLAQNAGWADDYQPIFYGWNSEHAFHGAKNETDVWEVSLPSIWEIDRTKKNDLHPTMKPVELIARSIENSTKAGDVVLDFFGGSGSTLIAATKTGRVARLIELEPTYVDVIVRRWQDFTGKAATLEGDGRTFDQVASQRAKTHAVA